ncbi:MAG: hypothetical protein U5J96_07675 [Ignavibacteriaceae bacterium]|nr:hypothetical protein [Ignavibacteriaceae bacterium]
MSPRNGNTVQNVHAGIYVRGATAIHCSSMITIGASSAGNIITNFGGGSAIFNIWCLLHLC